MAFITKIKTVYCAVRTGSYNKTVYTSSFKGERNVRFSQQGIKKGTVSWDMTTCGFEGISCPYLRDGSSFQNPLVCSNPGPRPNFSYHVRLDLPQCTCSTLILKHQHLPATPHDVTSQTTIILALTAVRTTYLTPYSRVAQTSHISRDNLKILGDGRGI
jgi:hypothetical protein